jgi:ectoine hydroxylase-related dioxygenase (phytanoyl-CoA dioxygenase family)
MLIDDQKATQFREHGYTAVEKFFDDREVAAMQAEVQRWREEGLLRDVTPKEEGATDAPQSQNLQLIPISDHSRLFKALPFVDKVRQSVAKLIGEPFKLHLDQTFLKPARKGRGTSWHQDNGYFKVENPLHGTAMWIAVHEATEANGTIRIIPDAFNEPLEHARDPMSDHHIRCYPDESKAKVIELPAGGVAFFCYGTPHATGANNTDGDRAGVAMHFLRNEAKTEGRMQIGTELCEPHTTYGKAEYGEDFRGVWEKEVEKLAGAASV